MADMINYWVEVEPALIAEFLAAYPIEVDPENPPVPVPAVTYTALNSLSDDVISRLRDAFSDQTDLFKAPLLVGKSMYSTDVIKPQVDQLAIDEPGAFTIMAAWNYSTGLDLGLEWDDQSDEDPENWTTTGAALYPQNKAHLLTYMPDVWDGISDPEFPVYIPATVLVDVLLVFGQPRRKLDN